MNLEFWPLSKLIPYIRNPRKNDAAVDKMCASIKEFGFKVPVLAKSDGSVIDGHLRIKAAQKMGIAEVPVILCDEWTDAQVKAFRLLVNRSVNWAEWDSELLALEFADLKSLDFNLDLTGFDPEEITQISIKNGPTAGLTDDDAVPEVPEKPISQLGDLWLLGEHRVMCGDSTLESTVATLLAGGIPPFIMVTDPPYGVDYDPEWRNGHGGFSDVPVKQTGKVMNDDRVDWSPAWALFPGDVAYVWHAGVKAAEVAVSLFSQKFDIRAQIVWVKQQGVMSRGAYHWQHEPCWYAIRKGKTSRWKGDRKQTTAWQVQSLNPTGNRQEQKLGHGTQKPIEIMRRPVVNHTDRGESVYDPFLGSGSTLIACEKEGRICYGIDIDPLYCDVIIRRWQDFTGKKATLDSTGHTFAEVAEKRLGTTAREVAA